MNNILMIWPESKEIVHINYHYTQFGEIIDYLDKKIKDKIKVIDEDIHKEDIINFIKENNISKVVRHLNYENAENGFKLGKKIKENFEDIPIFAYGNVTIILPKLFSKSPFDVIHANGDFEISIQSFIKYYKTNDLEWNIGKLKGSKIITGEKMYSSKNGEYIDSDEWGISKENRVPIREYDKIKGKNRYILNVSRGCPFGCEHCLIQMTEGRKERRRSIKNVKSALEIIKNNYSHIKIWAANFTLDKVYATEFCDLMSDEFPELTWECATRIDLLDDLELLKLMNKSGCKQISLGVESLKNEELIGTKKFGEKEIQAAIENIHNSGMTAKCCIMLGMEGQTREDIIKTFDFLYLQKALIRPTIYTPYQLINDNVKLSDLSKYNRKTYNNSNMKDVSYSELISLVKKPLKYSEILKKSQFNY